MNHALLRNALIRRPLSRNQPLVRRVCRPTFLHQPRIPELFVVIFRVKKQRQRNCFD
jgi:hypothetical protein